MIGDIAAEKVAFWLFFFLCYRKWLMLFSLKLQRDNRKNALAVDPAEGKTGKRLYFSLYCGDETTTYYNRALFNCCNIMKIQAFPPFC